MMGIIIGCAALIRYSRTTLLYQSQNNKKTSHRNAKSLLKIIYELNSGITNRAGNSTIQDNVYLDNQLLTRVLTQIQIFEKSNDIERKRRGTEEIKRNWTSQISKSNNIIETNE